LGELWAPEGGPSLDVQWTETPSSTFAIEALRSGFHHRGRGVER
jgi:hypothetical protein